MGIPENELEQITQQYIEETDENIEVELGAFYSEGWVINDKETASKVDYVIHKLEEKIEENERIAASQKAVLQAKIDKLQEGIAKQDEWLERSTKGDKQRISDLETHLILFHKRTIAAEELENEKRVAAGKKPLKISKSIKLAYRDLTSRQPQFKIEKDDEKLAEWLEVNHPEYVVKEPNIKWAEFKKTLLTKEQNVVEIVDDVEVVVGTQTVYIIPKTGEIVPHVELIDQELEFKVKVNK